MSLTDPIKSEIEESAPCLIDIYSLQCAAAVHTILGESPTWCHEQQKLVWVDILTPAIHSFDPVSKEINSLQGQGVISSIAPASDNRWVLSTSAGILLVDQDLKSSHLLCHPLEGQTDLRYNDGKCDALGRLWLGAMATSEPREGKGRLYSIFSDGSFKVAAEDFGVPNGLGWSPGNRSMYFVDSAGYCVYEYEFDLERGLLGRRKTLIEFAPSEGKPDGVTVDTDGTLWIAMWDGWHVVRVGPGGRRLGKYYLPVPRPTSCAFGGDGLRQLFVTSASLRLEGAALEAAPLSGALFSASFADVTGMPTYKFQVN